MKALLLAGGLGTRLKPLTDDLPKCLMPINGIPILQIWIKKLVEAGITDIYINTHYKAELVNIFLASLTQYQSKIHLIYEPVLLGTAGTVKKYIDKFIQSELILIHADNYYSGKLNNLIGVHSRRHKSYLITMLLFRTQEPHNCGIVTLDQNSTVIKYQEKQENPDGNLANGAIFIVGREVLESCGKWTENENDFSRDIVPKYVGKILGYEIDDFLIDIGTIKNYLKAIEYDLKNLMK